MPFNNSPSYVSVAMDRATPIGNSPDASVEQRGRLHVKVQNEIYEPIPVNVVSGSGASDTVPTIVNATLVANTEASITFSPYARQILIKARSGGKIQLSFTSGQSNTNYVTIPPLACYYEGDLNLVSRTMYVQSPTSCVIEVLEWA